MDEVIKNLYLVEYGKHSDNVYTLKLGTRTYCHSPNTLNFLKKYKTFEGVQNFARYEHYDKSINIEIRNFINKYRTFEVENA